MFSFFCMLSVVPVGDLHRNGGAGCRYPGGRLRGIVQYDHIGGAGTADPMPSGDRVKTEQ